MKRKIGPQITVREVQAKLRRLGVPPSQIRVFKRGDKFVVEAYRPPSLTRAIRGMVLGRLDEAQRFRGEIREFTITPQELKDEYLMREKARRIREFVEF